MAYIFFRCLEQRWQRGGNAANNSTVLGILGAKAAFLGTIADSHEKRYSNTAPLWHQAVTFIIFKLKQHSLEISIHLNNILTIN